MFLFSSLFWFSCFHFRGFLDRCQVENVGEVKKSRIYSGILKVKVRHAILANMEEVTVDGKKDVQFMTRLKLTGGFTGSLFLPCTTEDVFNFSAQNRLTQTYQKRLILLNQEARQNNKLQIWITSRHA